MSNQQQPETRRQNKLRLTGNVSQVKPLNGGGAAISLAYNEGKTVNGQWEQTDTLFMPCIVPKAMRFIPNVGDKMTIDGFLASNNFTPQGGKKRFGIQIVINKILEYTEKQHQPAQQQGGHNQDPNQGQQPHLPAQQQGGYGQAPQQGRQRSQPAPQQNGYRHPQESAPQQHNYNDQSTNFEKGTEFGQQNN